MEPARKGSDSASVDALQQSVEGVVVSGTDKAIVLAVDDTVPDALLDLAVRLYGGRTHGPTRTTRAWPRARAH